MSLTGKIMDFFADKDMTIPAFPRTKVKAVSDDDGVGLDAILNDIESKIGDTSVSEQIDTALSEFSSGKTLEEHLAEEDMILSHRQYGDKLPGEDGEPYTHVPGRIFFKRIQS